MNDQQDRVVPSEDLRAAYCRDPYLHGALPIECIDRVFQEPHERALVRGRQAAVFEYVSPRGRHAPDLATTPNKAATEGCYTQLQLIW